MRSILFINQFYFPDHSATSQLLEQLTEDMVRQGFKVSVLTGNVAYEGGKLAPRWRDNHLGAEVIRVRSSRFGKKSTLGRLVDYLSFHLATLLRLLRMPRHDVVVVLTTPPLIAWIGWIAKRWKRSRFVYWVQDLYPEVAAALGTLNPKSLVFRLCRAVSLWVLHQADCVVTVGDDMASRLRASGVSKEKIVTIHNWADEHSLFPGGLSQNRFIKSNGLEGKFLVVYAGNLGRAHRFHEILEAAVSLRDDENIEFVFVGSGNRKDEILAAKNRHHLSHLKLFPYVPRGMLGEVLGAAGIGLVTQAPITVGLLVPSKLYGLMAAGRPILFLGPAGSDAAQIIRAAQCGFVVEPGNPIQLVDIIRRLQQSPDEVENLGLAGRRYFLSHFTRDRAARHFGALFGGISQDSLLKYDTKDAAFDAGAESRSSHSREGKPVV